MRRSEGRNLMQLNKNKTGSLCAGGKFDARRKRAQGGLKPFQKRVSASSQSSSFCLSVPILHLNSCPYSLVPFQNCRKRCRQPAVGSRQARADRHLASQKVFPVPFGSGLPQAMRKVSSVHFPHTGNMAFNKVETRTQACLTYMTLSWVYSHLGSYFWGGVLLLLLLILFAFFMFSKSLKRDLHLAERKNKTFNMYLHSRSLIVWFLCCFVCITDSTVQWQAERSPCVVQT